MSIRLVAFDLDGTFLYDDKSVPAENLRALETAIKQGAYIVPASGRIYTGMPPEIKALPSLRYMIAANGAQVYDILEDRSIYEALIPVADALELLRFADTLGVYYDCYLDDRGYMTKYMYDDIESIVDIPGILNLIKTLRRPVDELKAKLIELGRPLQKLQFYVRDPQRKVEIISELKRRFPALCVTSSIPMNIEINSSRASKGQALTALCAQLGIPTADVIAFGDGTNDSDMLKAAGIGVAMENAVDEVKASADYITLSNMDDGFAKALYKFL